MSLEEELRRARKEWPFEDMEEAQHWQAIWCSECVHRNGCPLLFLSGVGRIPEPWTEREGVTPNKYTCREFTQDESSR